MRGEHARLSNRRDHREGERSIRKFFEHRMTIGAAVGLLFYLYISASVVLLGAEVNAAIYCLGEAGGKSELGR
jgi:hypothetical protein